MSGPATPMPAAPEEARPTPPISVVVVSRERPQHLPICLKSLSQLYYPNFEIVVVADMLGTQAVHAAGYGKRVKVVPFDEANISAARNEGIRHAAGEIVAFIDDDAVAEPTWLDYLAQAFEEPGIGAAGGYVRGPDGIAFQWRANLVDPAGRSIELDAAGKSAFKPGIPEGFGVKTEGTNCAFRRDVLVSVGGFDPSFSFYHDDTDLDMRLMRNDVETMIVPAAQVHHGLAPSARRGPGRAPRGLHQIGVSQMLFLRRYCPPIAHGTALGMFRETQRKRLLRAMVAGLIEPADVARLEADLEAGLAEGAQRPFAERPDLGGAPPPFLRFQRRRRGHHKLIVGRLGSMADLRARALARVAEGHVVTVLQLSPGARPHRVHFDPDGFWVQKGGLFGRSIETEKRFRLCRFGARARREALRVAYLREPLELDPTREAATSDAGENDAHDTTKNGLENLQRLALAEDPRAGAQ